MKEYYQEYYELKLKIKDIHKYNNTAFNTVNKHPEIMPSELEHNGEKHLIENSEPVSRFLFSFRNNLHHIINMIMLSNKKEHESIIDFVGHFFFNNILNQNPENDELLTLITELLIKEIEAMNDLRSNSFLDNSFLGGFLRSLIKRYDIKAYLSMNLTNLIIDMDNNNDNFLEIDIVRISEHLRSNEITGVVKERYLDKSSSFFEVSTIKMGEQVKSSNLNKNRHIDDCKANKMSILSNDASNVINIDGFSEKSTLIETINEDYMIDLTMDELNSRYDKETEGTMKIFCKYIYII